MALNPNALPYESASAEADKQQLVYQLIPYQSASAEQNSQPFFSYFQSDFTAVRQLQVQVGGHFCQIMQYPPPQFAPFPAHYYPAQPPLLRPAGNFIAPPPEKAELTPAAVNHCKQMWVPVSGIVVTERQRKTRRNFGRKAARGGGRSGNDRYVPAGKRSGFVGENKDVRKRDSYAVKYCTVALTKKERDTTVMLKNIPYEYTPTMLVEFMDDFCKAENRRDRSFSTAYDFFYLPMDFKTNKSKGYAFINFTHPEAAWNFFVAYDQTPWEDKDKPSSSKTRNIVRARIQGKNALVTHFQASRFECETIEFLPRSFDPARDGSGGKVRVSSVGRRFSRY